MKSIGFPSEFNSPIARILVVIYKSNLVPYRESLANSRSLLATAISVNANLAKNEEYCLACLSNNGKKITELATKYILNHFSELQSFANSTHSIARL